MIIEKFIIDYLSEKLEVPVYAERPQKDKEEMIIVDRSSMYVHDHIGYANITIWSYSNTMIDAAELDEKVQIAMRDIIETYDISKCSLENSYNDTLTNDDHYRFRSVYDVVFYL